MGRMHQMCLAIHADPVDVAFFNPDVGTTVVDVASVVQFPLITSSLTSKVLSKL